MQQRGARLSKDEKSDYILEVDVWRKKEFSPRDFYRHTDDRFYPRIISRLIIARTRFTYLTYKLISFD